MKKFHLKADIEVMLRSIRDLDGLLCDRSGRVLDEKQAEQMLYDELDRGHRVLPVGEPCEGFDFSEGGCPGHKIG